MILTVNLLVRVIDISVKNSDIWSASVGQRYGVYFYFLWLNPEIRPLFYLLSPEILDSDKILVTVG